MKGNFNRPRGNVISGGEREDTLEGVRDYPSGVTLSNVAALLQHLMQSPTYIKSVLQRLERVSPEYCYSKSAGQNDNAFPLYVSSPST